MPEGIYAMTPWLDLLKKNGVPASTYRLQFHQGFTFADAAALVPYLAQLGITDIYASPIFTATPGSQHGYDICDHAVINPELGGEAGFEQLVQALHSRNMGLVLDVVPNHMAAHTSANAWWRDILENGPSSPFALYFDIDWDPVKPEMKNKILLPILGDQYGQVLERGELAVEYAAGLLRLRYFENDLPLNPRQSVKILSLNLEALRAALGEADPDLQEFLSIQTALTNLPSYTARAAEKIEERRREKEVCRNRLNRLTTANGKILQHIQANLQVYNGEPGNRASFDRLHELLEVQAYRLAYWRTALDEINYRRFFDINTLAGLRQEYDPAFVQSHVGVFRLIQTGKIRGVRLDHIDGIYDPAAYLAQLQTYIAAGRAAAAPDAEKPTETPAAPKLDFYVVVEKILSLGEELAPQWLTHGTSGYDFLNDVNGILIDARHALEIKKIYARFFRDPLPLSEIIYQSKYAIMVDSMVSELSVLAHALNRLSELDRRTRDFTLETLRRAIREVVAAFPIYRTYVTASGVTANDEKVLDQALAKTRNRHPTMEPTILEFLRRSMLPVSQDPPDAAEAQRLEFAMKLQQYTAPVQAKGVEDTAFYRYNLLLSLNEVGGDPQRFGRSLKEFHQANERRRAQHPFAMLATSTHDTKRGEDARARINVLTELPAEWKKKIREWSVINASARAQIGGAWAPDRNEEYFIYQTLLGVWPAGWAGETVPGDLLPRLQAYLTKALREAKVHTSWVHNHNAYEDAVLLFAEKILTGRRSKQFLKSFLPFQRRVAYFGLFNSLSQVALKIASPGVPDFYQGTEGWDLSLADPDNRRPVDFEQRRKALESLHTQWDSAGPERQAFLSELLLAWPDARVKLWVTARGLGLRQTYKELFLLGDYQPVTAEEDIDPYVAGFSRSYQHQHLVVVVPRRVCTRLGGREDALPLGREAWSEMKVSLPASLEGHALTDALTGNTLARTPGQPVALAELFSAFPIALLVAG